ncbi:hypothetical protein [Photorhabdus heterorhabditis]|uniref:hypothetical protein n=1 Tax=Photorhabdus heterorhabditis TaxID=880156 RepID=UPI0021CE1C41|nr:hypothetical protein [Photorhabdus heterorhabditis]
MEWVVVDSNHLSVEQNQSRSEELVNCQGDTSCRSAVRDKYRQEYDKVQELTSALLLPKSCGHCKVITAPG